MPRIIRKHNRDDPGTPPPRTRAATQQKNREYKNGAALFRYCAVLCYLNSDLYGADGETRTLTPCGAGT